MYVKSAEYRGDFFIEVVFSNEIKTILNLRPLIENDERIIVRELFDPSLFARARVQNDTLAWPNGFDIAPEYLYDLVLNTHHSMEILMPSISAFYGITIWMFYADHQPPHFHVEYGEYKAVFAIESLAMLSGDLPRRAMALVLEWAALHRAELVADWDLSRNKEKLNKIPPLE